MQVRWGPTLRGRALCVFPCWNGAGLADPSSPVVIPGHQYRAGIVLGRGWADGAGTQPGVEPHSATVPHSCSSGGRDGNRPGCVLAVLVRDDVGWALARHGASTRSRLADSWPTTRRRVWASSATRAAADATTGTTVNTARYPQIVRQRGPTGFRSTLWSLEGHAPTRTIYFVLPGEVLVVPRFCQNGRHYGAR